MREASPWVKEGMEICDFGLESYFTGTEEEH
jgi:hypothetical protein